MRFMKDSRRDLKWMLPIGNSSQCLGSVHLSMKNTFFKTLFAMDQYRTKNPEFGSARTSGM